MAIYLEEAQYVGKSYMGRKTASSRLYADIEDQEACYEMAHNIVSEYKSDEEDIQKILYWRQSEFGETPLRFFWINNKAERARCVAAGVVKLDALESMRKVLEITGELLTK